MTTAVHVHTDNDVVSGSDATLLVLVKKLVGDPTVDLCVSWRSSPDYDAALVSKLPAEVRTLPLQLPHPANLKRAVGRWAGPFARPASQVAGRVLPVRKLCFAIDVFRLARLFRRTRPDILHVNNGGYPGAISCNAAVIAARIARVDCVVYVINNLAVGYRARTRWWDWPIDVAVRSLVTVFVTGSDAAGRSVEQVLRIGRSRRRVIPNTAPSARSAGRLRTRMQLGVDDTTAVVLVAARFEGRKGHACLLSALDILRRRGLSLPVVWLAGDGPLEDQLRHSVAERQLDDCVHFLGHRTDMPDLLAACDLVVLPSITAEDFPVTIVEAMAAARPVVATRVAGIPEQVEHGVTGWLVDPGKDEVLADGLALALSDSDLWAAMGEAGRRRYEERYTPEVVTNAYRTLYADLVRRTSSSGPS